MPEIGEFNESPASFLDFQISPLKATKECVMPLRELPLSELASSTTGTLGNSLISTDEFSYNVVER